MNHDFDTFLSQLRETNATLGFFVDFPKVSANVKSIEMKLNTLNYLLGKENIPEAVNDLWAENPKCFTALEILIAVRSSKNKMVITSGGDLLTLKSFLTSPQGIVEYLEGTGLTKVFQDRKIKNLVDYVFGVEVGLDSNARKNRSGTWMERACTEILKGCKVEFTEQVTSDNIPALRNIFGDDTKRFDFQINAGMCHYMVEVNFYSTGGSKLNEVARAYVEIYDRMKKLPGYEFVWVTDGKGWLKAKGKLEDAYRSIPHLYNLTTFPGFVRSLC